MSRASRAYKEYLKQYNKDYGYPYFNRKDGSLKEYRVSRRLDEGTRRILRKVFKDNQSRKKADIIKATRCTEKCFNLDEKSRRRIWW